MVKNSAILWPFDVLANMKQLTLGKYVVCSSEKIEDVRKSNNRSALVCSSEKTTV